MWHWHQPHQRTAWWSLGCTVGYVLLWVGQVFIVDPWAQTPFDDFSQRLSIMIGYAVVHISVGILAGVLAVWACWRDGERSRWMWLPIILGGILTSGVLRALLLP